MNSCQWWLIHSISNDVAIYFCQPVVIEHRIHYAVLLMLLWYCELLTIIWLKCLLYKYQFIVFVAVWLPKHIGFLITSCKLWGVKLDVLLLLLRLLSTEMRLIHTNRVSWSLCGSVGLLATNASPAKWLKGSWRCLWGQTCMGSRNCVVDGSAIAYWRHLANTLNWSICAHWQCVLMPNFSGYSLYLLFTGC